MPGVIEPGRSEIVRLILGVKATTMRRFWIERLRGGAAAQASVLEFLGGYCRYYLGAAEFTGVTTNCVLENLLSGIVERNQRSSRC